VPRGHRRLGLDHHDRDVVPTRGVNDAAGDDHVEDGLLELLVRREGDPLVVDERDPGGADRAAERQSGELGRRGRGVDGHDVVQVIGVQCHHGDDDLHLVAQALRERGAQRPVGEPAGEDGVLGGAPLTAEERAGDAARGVHPLFDVDGEREEVEVLLGLLSGRRGREEHCLVVEVGGD
jgi:hypothetical protein